MVQTLWGACLQKDRDDLRRLVLDWFLNSNVSEPIWQRWIFPMPFQDETSNQAVSFRWLKRGRVLGLRWSLEQHQLQQDVQKTSDLFQLEHKDDGSGEKVTMAQKSWSPSWPLQAVMCRRSCGRGRPQLRLETERSGVFKAFWLGLSAFG